jgi:hypothetical protein
MKEKLQALRVNQPLRLSKEGPAFSAPDDARNSQAENSAKPSGKPPTGVVTPEATDRQVPVLSVIGTDGAKERQVELSTAQKTQWAFHPEGDNTHGPNAKSAQPVGTSPTGCAEIDYPLGKIPTGTNDPLAKKPSGANDQRAKLPEVNSPTGEASHGSIQPKGVPPKRFVDYTAPGPLDVFLPANRLVADWKEVSEGKLHLPHRLMEFAIKATSSRNELILFLFFIRYTLGFRRARCMAGYSLLTDWTGISDVTNLRKGLKALMAAKLIVKTKEHDSVANTGAVYEVPVVRFLLEIEHPDDSTPPDNGPWPGRSSFQNQKPSGQENQRANHPEPSVQNHQGPVGDLPTKKEIIKENLNKTLSAEISPILANQISQTRPLRKRESERRHLESLLDEYDSTEIAKALLYVKGKGILISGETCRNPFAYLSMAIDDVLSSANATYANPEKYMMLASVDSCLDRGENSLADSAQDFSSSLVAFENDLGTEVQEQIITQYVVSEFPHGFLPPRAVIRKMAATSWFKDQKNTHSIDRRLGATSLGIANDKVLGFVSHHAAEFPALESC